MDHETRVLVADTLGVAPELLPLLPELYADLSALGGWPDHVATILRESAELPNAATVIDLGCGKGAVTIALAANLGCRVTGVDLFEPFLESAAADARTAGVEHLCTFQIGDIRAHADPIDTFDVAVFSAVGASLYGNFSDCVAAVRRWTRRGGYIVISDGFLRKPILESAMFPGFEYYQSHEEAVRQLTAHGDELVREILVTPDEYADQSLLDLEGVRRRVARVGQAHPGRRDQLEEFLAEQEAEYVFIAEYTTEVIWLLRRG